MAAALERGGCLTGATKAVIGIPPLLGVFAQLHHDTAWAAPDAFPSRPEAPRDELAQLIGYDLGRWLGGRPYHRFLGRTRPPRRVTASRVAELSLFERKPEQLGPFVLRDKGA